jgi:group I intron endonuclease
MSQSGIYAIRRTGTDKVYVGSALCVTTRWATHRRCLRKGCHPSKHLQNSWNKHGASSFECEVLENCSPEMLLEREQYWIDTLKPAYNTALFAGAPMRGRRHTSEWKVASATRMMGNQHARGHRHTDEWKQQTAARQLGKKKRSGWHHTSEAKARIAEAMRGQQHAKGHVATDDERARRSASIRAAYQRSPKPPVSPEMKARIAATLRGRKLSDETRQRMSLAHRDRLVRLQAAGSI